MAANTMTIPIIAGRKTISVRRSTREHDDPAEQPTEKRDLQFGELRLIEVRGPVAVAARA